jgi:hypothetical protein
VTKAQIAALVLKNVGKHLLRRWYVYGTFLIIFTAPFPVVLVVGLGWLGYFNYRVLTLPKEKDTL